MLQQVLTPSIYTHKMQEDEKIKTKKNFVLWIDAMKIGDVRQAERNDLIAQITCLK